MPRGRKPLFTNSYSIVEVLRAYEAGDATKVSEWYRDQLIARGFLEKFKMPTEGRRGRARIGYKLAPKGRTLITLSKNWKKAA